MAVTLAAPPDPTCGDSPAKGVTASTGYSLRVGGAAVSHALIIGEVRGKIKRKMKKIFYQGGGLG